MPKNVLLRNVTCATGNGFHIGPKHSEAKFLKQNQHHHVRSTAFSATRVTQIQSDSDNGIYSHPTSSYWREWCTSDTTVARYSCQIQPTSQSNTFFICLLIFYDATVTNGSRTSSKSVSKTCITSWHRSSRTATWPCPGAATTESTYSSSAERRRCHRSKTGHYSKAFHCGWCTRYARLRRMSTCGPGVRRD